MSFSKSLASLLLVALLSFLPSPATANQCYLEGGACALCWVTDSAGNRDYAKCPDSVTLEFIRGPALILYEGESYDISYSVFVNRSKVTVVPVSRDSSPEVHDLVHANVHACLSAAGSCTPFVEDNPGLSTHTPEKWGDFPASRDRVEFSSKLEHLEEGKYTIIAHVRFWALDDTVEIAVGGCGGKDCLAVWDVAFGVWSMVQPAEESPQRACYLKHPEAEDCDLCWTTDSNGVRAVSVCPESLRVEFDTLPPAIMFDQETYRVKYSLTVGKDMASRIVDDGQWHIPHANIHSCRAEVGPCTPFVEDTPRLSTHTPENKANLSGNGTLALAADVNLLPGKYTVIVHFRFQVLDNSVPNPAGRCNGQDCVVTYDVATGMRAAVFPIRQVLGDQECVDDEDCTACWMNTIHGSTMTPCNPGITAYFSRKPPKVLFSGDVYPVRYAIAADSSLVSLEPHPEAADGSGDFAEAFLAICAVGEGRQCGPVPPKDGPGGRAAAPNGLVVAREAGQITFQSQLSLPPGEYVVVAHFQTFLPNPNNRGMGFSTCDLATECAQELNIALTLPRAVVAAPDSAAGDASETNSSLIIIASVVGVLVVVLLAAMGAVVWGMRSGRCLPQKFIDNRMTIDEAGSLTVNVKDGGALTVNTVKKVSKLTRLADKPNLPFMQLAQQVINLHEGLGDEYRHIPMRFVSAAYVKSAQSLTCYEEMSSLAEHVLDIPYSETTQELWDKSAVVSWRWSKLKPEQLQPGFTPLSIEQLTQLQIYLENNKNIQYVWLDWSCVPQYTGSPMFEVARSKLFYSRARMMCILPTSQPLASGGEMRVILSTAIRTLASKWQQCQTSLGSGKPSAAASGSLPLRLNPTNSYGGEESMSESFHYSSSGKGNSVERERQENTMLAVTVLKEMRNKQAYAQFGYFGRVWTLAERMARHGRNESLRNWLDLELWLGMTLDALWQASDPASEEMEPVLGYYWGKIFDRARSLSVINSLRKVRQRGSSLASDSINDQIADLFVDAVQVWKSAFQTEALDIQWLKHYLMYDAGHLYQCFMAEDLVYSIYTFFCWHLREDFATSHNDLCLLAGITEDESELLHTVRDRNGQKAATPSAKGGPLDPAKEGSTEVNTFKDSLRDSPQSHHDIALDLTAAHNPTTNGSGLPEVPVVLPVISILQEEVGSSRNGEDLT